MSIGNADVRDQERDVIRANALNAVFSKENIITFAASAKATKTIDPTGTQNSLDFTSELEGSAGNDISIEYVDPGALGQSLDVSVDGNKITVSLATDTGTDEVQIITVAATGGTWFASFRGQHSNDLAYNATAAQVQSALEDLMTIGAGNVDVSGSTGGPYTVTFQGDLAATNVETIGVNGNKLKPYSGHSTKPRVEIAEKRKGTGSVDEQQTITLVHHKRGTFKLTYDGQETSALAWNISAANMLIALQALSNWDDSAGAVSKSGNVYTVTFSGTGLTHTDVSILTADATGLLASVSVAVDTPGVAYAISTTAGEIITAIRANDDADALVAVANHAANDGTGRVTAMTEGFLTGGLPGHGSKSGQASYTTSLSGHTNNDLIFTAVPTGTAGDGIKISYVDPGGTTAALSLTVDVQERTIVVNLARAASAISTIASDIATAIAADTEGAALLVTVANAGGNDGTGLVEAMSVQTLAGGGEGAITLFTARGDMLVAINLNCDTDLTGASSTLEVGKAGATAALVPTTTCTTIDAGGVVDKTGVAATPTTTPFYPLNDGESIILTPKTANITGGKLTAVCYFKRLTEGAYVH